MEGDSRGARRVNRSGRGSRLWRTVLLVGLLTAEVASLVAVLTGEMSFFSLAVVLLAVLYTVVYFCVALVFQKEAVVKNEPIGHLLIAFAGVVVMAVLVATAF